MTLPNKNGRIFPEDRTPSNSRSQTARSSVQIEFEDVGYPH